MSQIDHIKKLLSIHQRNLQLLKEKEAAYGLDVPVSVLNQIASEEAEIESLQGQLESLGGTVEPSPAPAETVPSATSPASQSDGGGSGVTFNIQGDVHLGDGVVITGRDAHNVQTNVTKTKNMDLAQIATLFKELYLDIDESASPLKEQAKSLTEQIEEEVTKPDGKPDEGKIEGLLRGIKGMAPDIFEVAITTFANPAAGVAMVISKIGAKIKAEAG